MQNYLSKQNLGIPAGLACITAYLLGYGVTRSLGLLWVAVVFTAFVFLFNFDEKVRSAVKRGVILSASYYVVTMVIYILRSIVAWFSSSKSATSEWDALLGTASSSSGSTVVNKVITIVGDLAEFVILIAFIALIVSAFLNKDKNVKFLDQAATETKSCPQCGTKITAGAEFCTRCGTKLS